MQPSHLPAVAQRLHHCNSSTLAYNHQLRLEPREGVCERGAGEQLQLQMQWRRACTREAVEGQGIVHLSVP